MNIEDINEKMGDSTNLSWKNGVIRRLCWILQRLEKGHRQYHRMYLGFRVKQSSTHTKNEPMVPMILFKSS